MDNRQTSGCRPIDALAIRTPQRSGLPPCLYIPIGARDPGAIEAFVGKIVDPPAPRSLKSALLVESYSPGERDDRLSIWSLPESAILHARLQVWVHVDDRTYRRAYARAFPKADLTDQVLDHVLNRRVARLKGFTYLRIVPVTRATNSSHGGLSERWGVDYHSTPEMRAINNASKAYVQYADLSDVVKMLNMGGGGSLMDNVNEAQKLVRPPP